MVNEKIRIRLKAYRSQDPGSVDAVKSSTRPGGPAPEVAWAHPSAHATSPEVYCVLRSPHVDKKSREQFEIRTHKRLLDIYDPTSNTVDALMKLELPAGVDVEIKL